jgi:hypothetical protein
MAERTADPRSSQDLIRAALETIVFRVFPNAVPDERYGMNGWRIARDPAPAPAAKGSPIDPRYVLVLPAFRKAGLSLHLTNPADYYFLDGFRTRLETAGFKVMRNCLQWNRTGEPSWALVEELLREMKRSAGA